MMETELVIIDEKEYVEQILELLLDCGYELLGERLICPNEARHKQIAEGIIRMREYLSLRHQLVIGDGYLVVDFDEYMVKRAGEDVHLTPTEFKILAALLQSPNRIYSRGQLIAYALDSQFEGYDRSIDTYIKSIRKKIEPNRHEPRYIRTVHGVGYKFVP